MIFASIAGAIADVIDILLEIQMLCLLALIALLWRKVTRITDD